MSEPFTLRWGIISTGWIAGCFVRDISLEASTRNVHDIAHKITAVGSRTVEKSQEFVNREIGADKGVKAYGSYEEVYADKDVDAVYIGTPHTSHYINARDAIKAKKHVLCEKPVTSNAAELRSLLALAKENDVFFMEAMWTRFQPLMREVKRVSETGELGDPIVLHADLSGDFDIENIPKTHRILDPELGGGALLDLGPYPLVWAIVALFEHPKNNNTPPSHISGSMLKTPLTGVDSSTSFTLTFPTLQAQAILSCSINLPSNLPGVTIRYRKGNILIPPPIYNPRSFCVQYFDKVGSGNVVREVEKEFNHSVGKGWHYQADEIARCVKDGKRESEIWTHEKCLMEMQIFDEVRKQGDYKFPEGVEQVV